MALLTEGFFCGTAAAARDAAFTPEWATRFHELWQALEKQVESAAKQGAFTFASTFPSKTHALYIRPTGLFDKAKSILMRQEDAGVASETRGVLIWGSKGMGKTSLAKDIAYTFAHDSGTS